MASTRPSAERPPEDTTGFQKASSKTEVRHKSSVSSLSRSEDENPEETKRNGKPTKKRGLTKKLHQFKSKSNKAKNKVTEGTDSSSDEESKSPKRQMGIIQRIRRFGSRDDLETASNDEEKANKKKKKDKSKSLATSSVTARPKSLREKAEATAVEWKLKYKSEGSSSDDEDFAKDVLSLANRCRRKHRVRKLRASRELNVLAYEWSRTLARDKWTHDRDERNYGRNVYCKTSTTPGQKVTAEEVVSSWYREIEDYNFEDNPANARETQNATQLLWKNSEEIGVAKSKTFDRDVVFVAAYFSPRGNIAGQYKSQVLPLGGFDHERRHDDSDESSDSSDEEVKANQEGKHREKKTKKNIFTQVLSKIRRHSENDLQQAKKKEKKEGAGLIGHRYGKYSVGENNLHSANDSSAQSRFFDGSSEFVKDSKEKFNSAIEQMKTNKQYTEAGNSLNVHNEANECAERVGGDEKLQNDSFEKEVLDIVSVSTKQQTQACAVTQSEEQILSATKNDIQTSSSISHGQCNESDSANSSDEERKKMARTSTTKDIQLGGEPSKDHPDAVIKKQGVFAKFKSQLHNSNENVDKKIQQNESNVTQVKNTENCSNSNKTQKVGKLTKIRSYFHKVTDDESSSDGESLKKIQINKINIYEPENHEQQSWTAVTVKEICVDTKQPIENIVFLTKEEAKQTDNGSKENDSSSRDDANKYNKTESKNGPPLKKSCSSSSDDELKSRKSEPLTNKSSVLNILNKKGDSTEQPKEHAFFYKIKKHFGSKDDIKNLSDDENITVFKIETEKEIQINIKPEVLKISEIKSDDTANNVQLNLESSLISSTSEGKSLNVSQSKQQSISGEIKEYFGLKEYSGTSSDEENISKKNNTENEKQKEISEAQNIIVKSTPELQKDTYTSSDDEQNFMRKEYNTDDAFPPNGSKGSSDSVKQLQIKGFLDKIKKRFDSKDDIRTTCDSEEITKEDKINNLNEKSTLPSHDALTVIACEAKNGSDSFSDDEQKFKKPKTNTDIYQNQNTSKGCSGKQLKKRGFLDKMKERFGSREDITSSEEEEVKRENEIKQYSNSETFYRSDKTEEVLKKHNSFSSVDEQIHKELKTSPILNSKKEYIAPVERPNSPGVVGKINDKCESKDEIKSSSDDDERRSNSENGRTSYKPGFFSKINDGITKDPTSFADDKQKHKDTELRKDVFLKELISQDNQIYVETPKEHDFILKLKEHFDSKNVTRSCNGNNDIIKNKRLNSNNAQSTENVDTSEPITNQHLNSIACSSSENEKKTDMETERNILTYKNEKLSEYFKSKDSETSSDENESKIKQLERMRDLSLDVNNQSDLNVSSSDTENTEQTKAKQDIQFNFSSLKENQDGVETSERSGLFGKLKERIKNNSEGSSSSDNETKMTIPVNQCVSLNKHKDVQPYLITESSRPDGLIENLNDNFVVGNCKSSSSNNKEMKKNKSEDTNSSLDNMSSVSISREEFLEGLNKTIKCKLDGSSSSDDDYEQNTNLNQINSNYQLPVNKSRSKCIETHNMTTIPSKQGYNSSSTEKEENRSEQVTKLNEDAEFQVNAQESARRYGLLKKLGNYFSVKVDESDLNEKENKNHESSSENESKKTNLNDSDASHKISSFGQMKAEVESDRDSSSDSSDGHNKHPQKQLLNADKKITTVAKQVFECPEIYRIKQCDSLHTFEEELLSCINICRGKHNAENLELDKKLCDLAHKRAESYASGIVGNIHKNLGENVFVFSSTEVFTNLQEKACYVLEHWYKFICYHDFGAEPVELDLKSGPFSQLVWKESRGLGVGCASVGQDGKEVVVAVFWPCGNVEGQYREQVEPA